MLSLKSCRNAGIWFLLQMTKNIFLGLFRHFLTAIGTWGVATGWLDGADVDALVNGVIAIAGVVFSIADKVN